MTYPKFAFDTDFIVHKHLIITELIIFICRLLNFIIQKIYLLLNYPHKLTSQKTKTPTLLGVSLIIVLIYLFLIFLLPISEKTYDYYTRCYCTSYYNSICKSILNFNKIIENESNNKRQ